jgi:hypothetical protein
MLFRYVNNYTNCFPRLIDPQVQIRVIFNYALCLFFFHFKDRIPLNLRSHVVYQFECQCCNALYLGKTCRHLHTRISEQCGISALTGNPLSCVSKSSISDHSREACHPMILKLLLQLILTMIFLLKKVYLLLKLNLGLINIFSYTKCFLNMPLIFEYTNYLLGNNIFN